MFCIPPLPPLPHPSCLPLCSWWSGDPALGPLTCPSSTNPSSTPWFLTHQHPLQASYRCMLSCSEAGTPGFPAPGLLGCGGVWKPGHGQVCLYVQLSWLVVEWVLTMNPERGWHDPNPQEPDRWARCQQSSPQSPDWSPSQGCPHLTGVVLEVTWLVGAAPPAARPESIPEVRSLLTESSRSSPKATRPLDKSDWEGTLLCSLRPA